MTEKKSAIAKEVKRQLKKLSKKFVPIHEFTKTLKGLDPSFQQFVDSAIDHMGKVAENTSLTEYAGLLMGIAFGIKTKAPPETILYLGASGLFAGKGLGSQSEAVGIASLATLSLFGAVSVGLPEGILATVKVLQGEVEKIVGKDTTGQEMQDFLTKLGFGKVVFGPGIP